MVVLVTGGRGQLGQALQSVAPDYPDLMFHFVGSSEVDITDKSSLSAIFERINPDFCINAAAYTAVDKAESEPEKATHVNVTGAINLAETCLRYNTTLIHISTDFVFDGQKTTPYLESDDTNPTGVYGRTKRDGENGIITVGGKYFIIRTSWLYSQFGANFMKTMLRLASERDTISVVNDQIGTPTHAVDLARAIATIIRNPKAAYGIYHYSNEGAASWYDFARKIFEVNGVNIDVRPIPTTDFPTPAKRPAYSVLDKTKIKQTFQVDVPDWQISLKRNR